MDLDQISKVGMGLRSEAYYWAAGLSVATGLALFGGGVALYNLSPAAFQAFTTNLMDGFNSVSYEGGWHEDINDAVQIALPEALQAPPFIIKDPIEGPVVPQESNSIGAEDDRNKTFLHQKIFNPVAELTNGCTATLVRIPDHQVLNNGLVFATAAHCLQDGQMPMVQGNYMAHEAGVYEERYYSTVAIDVWEHPFYAAYRDDIDAKSRQYTPYDIAMFRVDRDAIPAEVEPANLHFVDFSRLIKAELLKMPISSVGYSADRKGLTYHHNCNIVEASFQDFVSNCDIAGGASGGSIALPFDPESEEALKILGINGGTYLDKEHARHSFFESNMLNMIPFVVPVEGGESLECKRVATNYGNLNRRFEPNLNGRTLSSQESAYYTGTLPLGSLVQVFGSIDGWDLVRPIDGNGFEAIDQQFGYSYSQYLTPVPCPGVR